jgi:hypothetical protein
MAVGFFVVSATEDKRDILFQTKSPATSDPSEEQTTLVNEIERTLRVLRQLFDGRDADFGRYFDPLLSLAQGGLVGDNAQPAIARRALVELKTEVLEREAGRVKNRHMVRLGRAAALLGIPSLLVGLAARVASTFPEVASKHGVITGDAAGNCAFLIAGCAAGVWVSFGARKAQLVFEDLSVPEHDHLYPATRLAFTALLTAALGLLFHSGAAEVKIGTVSSSRVFVDPIAALLIGFLAGFSEQVLSKTIATHASRLIASEKN